MYVHICGKGGDLNSLERYYLQTVSYATGMRNDKVVVRTKPPQNNEILIYSVRS